MASLIAVGDNTMDVYLDRNIEYPGGNALNAAVFASRLGARSAYLGCVGDDRYGKCLLDSLQKEHVDTSRCRTLPGANGWACVDSIDGERVFLGSDPGVCRQLQLSTEDLAYIAQFPLAHSSLYSGLENQLAQIRHASGCLSFDFSDNWVEFEWKGLIGQVDIAFFSAADLPSQDAHELALQMQAMGPKIVVITRGARGALATDGQGIHEHPGLACSVVDSMGAGDGFIAAFLLANQARYGLAECLVRGVDYAVQVCGWNGGFGHGQTMDVERSEHLKNALKNQG
ncbi:MULTISPECIES: PfkB family carbohydrate kinase [Pseudomonas syringae group]|uniref:PfkB family carbohydrate kinase n=1 Tax=Pseudomonas syringae group TaxID=136849 RepID=UPI0005B70B03|nr:PfkB family carbohydrate kinase [Pseudomonas viridiflava]MBD8805040.1 fructoselysine kinase [Pseudomonas syringae]KIQ36545.1 fructoselysine kinase [Pseudomonas viridiflava]MEE4099529.1 PfkB family carbohydrate kinase [Pseudomonas viridiflava]MEE4127149.1 PfkB family carbohydrate kinase [Pseudomonas viridiflava]MEE4231655.1 PfkB family carbohydrate kinase [Pseudomonas viridiflava]